MNVGQSLEFRCQTNETSMFNRVKHTLENGTDEILLSNEHINPNFERSEIQISKRDHVYIVKISPIQFHSAGLYTCEDDVTSPNVNAHRGHVRLHVNPPAVRFGANTQSGATKGKKIFIKLKIFVNFKQFKMILYFKNRANIIAQWTSSCSWNFDFI